MWAEVDGVSDERDESTAAMTDLEVVIEALDCAWPFDAAGGREALTALTTDRPQLRAALAAGRAAVGRMPHVSQEPLVGYAADLLLGCMKRFGCRRCSTATARAGPVSSANRGGDARPRPGARGRARARPARGPGGRAPRRGPIEPGPRRHR